MTIQFDQIPASLRRPGKYLEFNTRLAVRGLPENRQKLLVIGQKLAAGSQDPLEVVQIAGEDISNAYFGRGSILALACSAALNANRYVDLWAIAQDDAGAAVAAAGDITFTNAATGAATLSIWIGNQKVDVLVETDDTATEIAAAVVAEMTTAKQPDLPVTAAVNGGDDTQVDLTAKNKGTLGNEIGIVVTWSSDVTTSAAITAMASGATDPDIQDALDVIFPEQYDLVVSAYPDSTNLGKLDTHLEDVAGALEQREGLGLFATTGTLTAATTLADALNSGFLSGGWLEATKSLSYEVAALVKVMSPAAATAAPASS